MDRIDILFVYMDEESFAVKIDIKEFPAIVLFRNGDPLRFEGNIENEMAVLKVLNLFYAFDVAILYLCNYANQFNNNLFISLLSL